MTQLASKVFGIDVRSLAALRIGLGLLLLADLGIRATDLQAHYTDAGVLPRELLADRYEHTCNWSIHMLTGSFAGQAALFALAAAAALALTLGVFSRAAALLSWVLLVSLLVRNPLITNAGDGLLRSLLFWSIFLPLDCRWSLRPASRHAFKDRTFMSVASAAVLIQIALMYWASGYYKLHGIWRSPDALQQLLTTDSYAKPMAYVLLGHPALLRGLTRAVLWSELIFPWLLFSPLWTKPIRILAIVVFGLFHLGIELTLTVGFFSYTCWLAWILFLPSDVWDRLLPSSIQPAQSSDSEAQDALRKRGVLRWGRFGINCLLCSLLGYIILYNVNYLPGAWTKGIMPRSWSCVADALACRQRWNMFQNRVRNDGWYIAPAYLSDGRVIDLLRGGAPADWESYTKPKLGYARFPNHHWRKYYRNLVSSRSAVYRKPLLRYLAAQWQHDHPDESRIESVELHYMQEIDTQDSEFAEMDASETDGDADQEERFQQRFLQTLQLDDSESRTDVDEQPVSKPDTVEN